MKEYFIARGLAGRLCRNPEEGKRLLMECDFGYEILEFAGKAISKRSEWREELKGNLCAFARETRGKAESPYRKQYERLGANSVNLLHYAGLPLEGEDWSGLLLDHGVLSGMDLSRKNFSCSSMRYAHLDNADLTNCDLGGCDFTGVQFVKSGQLTAFAVDPRDGALIAAYKDGKIRRWMISNGSTKLLSALNQGYGRPFYERVTGVDMDEMGGIYASFLGGRITRYRKNRQGNLAADKNCRLELKCRGASIEGVHPKEQYEVLAQAINEC